MSTAVLAASGAPSSAASSGASANGWIGTVSVVEDANHTFARTNSAGYAGTTTIVYHDQALYMLSGEISADGLEIAQMVGSGTGRATGSYPPSCTLTYSQFLQWSYSGQAGVNVSYDGGRFVVQPKGVDTTFTNLITGCGLPDSTQTSQAPAPEGITQIQPHGVTEPTSATSISGTETFPLSFAIANVSEDAGTVTLSWKLHRQGQALSIVPHVVGKSLSAAKKTIIRAGCTVGRVSAKHSAAARGRVLSQTPRAGKSVPRHTKVNLVVSRGRT